VEGLVRVRAECACRERFAVAVELLAGPRPPEGSTNIHPDHLVGRLGALGIVAALLRRERDGRGAHLQVAQFEVLCNCLGDLFIKEKPRARLGPARKATTANAACPGAPTRAPARMSGV